MLFIVFRLIMNMVLHQNGIVNPDDTVFIPIVTPKFTIVSSPIAKQVIVKNDYISRVASIAS